MTTNHEETASTGHELTGGLKALSEMPSFHEFRAKVEAENSDNESIENLEEEKENLERLILWQEAMTNLHDCLSNIQPGDDPKNWQREFFKKYDIAVIPRAEGEVYEEKFDQYIDEEREKAGERYYDDDWQPDMFLMDRSDKRFYLKEKVIHDKDDNRTHWTEITKKIDGDFPHSFSRTDDGERQAGIPDDTDFMAHPETAEMLNTVLADLFSDNVHDYSEINKNAEIGYNLYEKDAYDKKRLDSMPDSEIRLKAISEIEQILNNLGNPDELQARLNSIENKISAKYAEKAQIREQVEQREARLKDTENYLKNFDERLKFSKEDFDEEFSALDAPLAKVRAKFSDEGLKRIGIIEYSLDYDEERKAVNLDNFSNVVIKLAREYCSKAELTESQQAIFEIAKYRTEALELEEEDLRVVYAKENQDDMLAKLIASSIGIDTYTMQKLLGIK